MSSISKVPSIMVFYPTMDEFKYFSRYVNYMEGMGAHEAGIAKVVPPTEWKPRKKSYDDDDIMNLKIPSPISQVIQGKNGFYKTLNIEKSSMTVSKYKMMAESNQYKTPEYIDYNDIERKYWKNIIYNPPLYGADIPGSVTDKDVEVWNINKLGTILDYVNSDYGVNVEGVNTAYLYFGMWRATFAWHTEDVDLYSINYIHSGQPKTWYAISPQHGHRFERVASSLFPSDAANCSAFLRHKMTIISPNLLKNDSIPFNKVIQEKGEFIITFPYAYHAGFNHGFNIAESTNFALPRWVEYGKNATLCYCREDTVKINMDIFVKRFQPNKYRLWKLENDYDFK